MFSRSNRRKVAANRAMRLAAARLVAESDAESGMFAEELAECERLSGFIHHAWPVIEPGTDYLHNWHIDAISEHLECVTNGQIKRLLINIPPRYMKSIAVSIMWPVWEWTKKPHTRFMFATYSGSLSEELSLKRLTILQSDWFRERWGRAVQLTKENVATVINSRLGQFEATSFTGTATGKGANRLVIDDPHNPKKADSDVERAMTLKLFNTTFQSRLNDKKRDAIVVVMQRLHEEDVSARCIELGYVHLKLPAEAEGRTVVHFPSGREVVREDGDLLWPEREGKAELEAMHQSMGNYGYAGQYQQRPAPDGGGIFTTFPVIPALPAGVQITWVRYWDKAATEGGGKFTAGTLMGRVHTDPPWYVIADVTRGQWSSSNREKVIKDTAGTDGKRVHVWVEQEPGSGGKESAENTVKLLQGFVCKIDRVSGDKVTRAQPLAGQAQVGNVKLLEADWNHDFVKEAQSFPNGRFKDQVDSASGAFNKLVLSPRPAASSARGPAAVPPVPSALPGRPGV